MGKLQKQFIDFHDEIKLGTYDENDELREKRDMITSELKKSLKDEKVPGTDKKLTFESFDQGSYTMHTGIKPKNDDYDIDVGLVFDISNDEYNSNDLKKLVRDKLNAVSNRTVSFNTPCITVEYSKGYHVDLAIYSLNNDDMHIAWGKEFSSINQCWYESDPSGLTSWVKSVSSDPNESAQFRRCVRSLKKWKEIHFSSQGNVTPPSIGLTIQSRKAFVYYEGSDLEALINIVTSIKNEFSDTFDPESGDFKKSIDVNLPVRPYKNVYYKMTLKQQNNFHSKIEVLLEALNAAKEEESEYESSKILRKVFGSENFPLVEDVKKSTSAPYVTTGFNA